MPNLDGWINQKIVVIKIENIQEEATTTFLKNSFYFILLQI